MSFLKKIARNLKRSAPMGVATRVAKMVEPIVKKAQPSSALPTPKAPPDAPVGGPGAGMGPARRGLFSTLQQAARKIGPAVKEASPEMKKNFQANPAKVIAGIARGAVGRSMRFKDGGSVKTSRPVVSSGRGDGAAIRGKTKCKMY